MIDSIKHTDCTGCKMCADLCPTAAISYISDLKGCWYPQVEYEKCTHCGLCIARCPSLNESRRPQMDRKQVYAGWSKNDEVRLSSTSGGIFYEIAKHFIIQEKGVVVGSKFSTDYKSAYHTSASCITELENLKGSKYFQSDTSGIYARVKETLDSGKKVLFCGTPCQCAALASFLDGKYDNIYYLDFICRSINSPMAFYRFIEDQELKNESRVSYVRLKDKEHGWQSLATRIEFENGCTYLNDKNSDTWVRGFIQKDLYTRDSCFSCKFRALPRIVADITLGDFWGLKYQEEEELRKGISVIIVNSQNGNNLLSSVRNSIWYEPHSIDEVIQGNPALIKDTINNSTRSLLFFDYLKTHTFSESVEKFITQTKFSPLKWVKGFYKKNRGIFRLLSCVNIRFFIYYNYLAKNVIREKHSFILPYKGAILDIRKTAKIILKNGNLSIGINKLKKSKAETYVRIGENATWYSDSGCDLFYGTTVEIQKNATFENGYFSMNTGSVIVCSNNIKIGNDVMLGRNIMIYDNDHHQILNEFSENINKSLSVRIDDHVWATSNILILKGVHIEKGVIIGSYTTVRKDICANKYVSNENRLYYSSKPLYWSRSSIRIYN